MTETPEFLKDQKVEIEDLEKLHSMSNRYLELEKELEILEEAMKEKKKEFNYYSQEAIPQFLLSNGLSEIRLKTGEKIVVKEDISVTIKNDLLFFKFLQERNEDDLIKTHFNFSRMPSDRMEKLFTFLDQEEYDYDLKKDVHAQTKKKYFKELLGIGEEDYEEGLKTGKYIRKEVIDTFVKIFNYYITKIK